MTQIFKTVLSMSLSGAVLTAILLLVVRILKGRLGRQWQYYIWLIVVMRLLLPFGPETSLMGRIYQTTDHMLSQRTQSTQETVLGGQDSINNPAQSDVKNLEGSTEQSLGQNVEESGEEGAADNRNTVMKNGGFFSKGMSFAGKYLWVIWLVVAFGMLIRKVSMYQSYIKYVKAGAEPVGDVALLDQLAVAAGKLGIGRTVELCVNPLVASPMLVGYFHPCIILPGEDVSEKEICWIAMHELTHYRRCDILYKWLVQFAVCLHWFNPFVHLMSREIDRACEFSCDEAVISKMEYANAADYGKTLLDAMAAAGTYRGPFAVVTMSANKELLRERLGAIMSCKKKTKKVGLVTAGLTVCVVLAAVFIGVYPTAAAESGGRSGVVVESGKPDVSDEAVGVAEQDGAGKTGTAVRIGGSETVALSPSENMRAEGTEAAQEKTESTEEKSRTDAEKYYKTRSLPQFYIAFCGLSEEEQESWLERLYEDGEMQFFSVGVMRMDEDNRLIQSFSERFYEDGDIAFFFELTNLMDTETLEGWLDRATADQKLAFQSALHDKLNREENDVWEKAAEEEQRKAYEAVGVTWNGKNCYYNGQLVHIFLDMHKPDKSFYTLDMNLAGTVNIRIVRSEDGQISGVANLTEAEISELFGDLDAELEPEEAADEADAELYPRLMTVNMPACNIREGAGEAYKVVGMVGEGEQVVALGEKTGEGGQMWYLLDKKSLPNSPDASVKACYIRGDLLDED